MRELDLGLDMRQATIDDAEIVADLETAREPDDPRDPAMLRFWWSTRTPDEAQTKMVAVRNGEAATYVAAGHHPWEPNATRFGWIRPILHPDENQGVRQERFWIAWEGASMVGLSVIGYPPTRGVPWTFFTATAQSVRGRGVARAVKYATLAQATALGAKRVRTSNDGENAPILHLNTEMGYQLVDRVIELHHELSS